MHLPGSITDDLIDVQPQRKRIDKGILSEFSPLCQAEFRNYLRLGETCHGIRQTSQHKPAVRICSAPANGGDTRPRPYQHHLKVGNGIGKHNDIIMRGKYINSQVVPVRFTRSKSEHQNQHNNNQR